MNKRIISTALSLAVAVSAIGSFSITASAEAKTPQYQTKARQMEKLNRGLIAVKNADGVYLSWRLFGDESLEKQAFDIYRDGTYIDTVGGGEATCYIDKSGTANSKYKVVPENASNQQIENEPWVTPQETKGDTAWTYFDVPISKPTDIAHANTTALSDYTRTNKVGGPNDASLGDLDGDGDYEIVLKWDPKDSKDSNSGNTTGHCVFDAYEIDPDNGGYMWRIDIGNNIAAGAHYSQFMVYDFDGNGKAEIATLTAPGSYSLVKNKSGGYDKIYVTSVGDTPEIQNADNNATTLRKGNNNGPEYYTIFDGETGRPLRTTDAIPIGPLNEKGEVDSSYEDGHYWGDSKMNRSSRYLAAVAYLDGVTPYYVPIRGMYNRTILRAYTWDGENLTLVKEHNGDKKGSTMYGEGNHNLSVADIDNDGKDEIVYGSACLDDDFTTVLGNTKLGHGDAMHVSDFNNDGTIEVFSVKEDKEGWGRGADFRVAKTGTAIWSKKVSTDNGRGAMGNIDDAYAATHPEALALGWDAANTGAYNFKGEEVAAKPNGNSRSFCNFLVYWDDDLGRELLDDTQMAKYHADTGVTDRIMFNGQGYLPGNSNNGTKQTPSLVADLWGDWREEIIMPAENDTVLRIMTSTQPTKYRLTTLMHDSQYRLAIAWQNVGYNQPPHTSYYIGSAALATDEGGNTLNYLAPATAYTKVTYEAPEQVAVTGIEIANKEITVEKGKSASIGASVIPDEATKKGITYTSSDESVAKVSNGSVTGVSVGTATITATTKDGGFTDTCTVTVFENPVTGVSLSEKLIEFGIGNTATLTANVLPSNASDKSVVWSSDDDSVAEVNSEGVVTGVGLGKTTITATAGDRTAKCIVKVKPMNIVDATGEDVFEASGADGDKVKFTGTSNSALLTLNEAPSFVEFHKDFEAINKNTATLSFHFTTGGAKTTDYIWKLGHEYNTELKFLDTNGNKIFDIIEQHLTSGITTYYSVGDGGWQKASDWKKVSGDADNPWNRSQIRWDVKVTFDYTADTGTINLAGCNSSWERGATYETTFPLNGASFKTLKYETNTIKDWVSGNPKLEQLSYTSTEQVSGNTEVLYERGTEKVAWAEADLADWTQTGKDTAALQFDENNGRVWYNPIKPGTPEYSATKKIEGIADDAVVSYDVDWYFSASTGRNSNFEYIQFGDKLRIGALTDGQGSYYVLASTDGGTSYDGMTTIDSTTTLDETKCLLKIDKNTTTKNINVIFDKKANTIKSLTFDGKVFSAYTDYKLPDGAEIDSVIFGLQRGGGTSDWEYPNGIDKIRVAQFIEGEEAPDFSTIKVTGKNGKTAAASYELIDYAEDTNDVTLIGALYDGNKLIELKSQSATLPAAENGIIRGTESVEFNNDIGTYSVKVFMWNSVTGLKPFADVE